jgi:3-phenylpropionate/trans-cinnamate dioxygenase ferredoxin reductase subunit
VGVPKFSLNSIALQIKGYLRQTHPGPVRRDPAGRHMTGANETYNHIPMFYSDLFELGYEAVGDLSSKLKTVEDWHEETFKKGIVYYLDNGRVRGVLLWNVWEKVDEARALMREKGPFKEQGLKGRITG